MIRGTLGIVGIVSVRVAHSRGHRPGGEQPHGLNAHEVDVYVNQFGMSPLAAIQTGTINAADLMSWTDKIGTLEPGKWADIIAIDGDPLKDVKILQHVNFVMKSGVVYKDETHKQ